MKLDGIIEKSAILPELHGLGEISHRSDEQIKNKDYDNVI